MLNRAIMMGRLCADPELKHTQTQVAVCSFRIAVDRDYSKNGEKETDFFDVVAWRAMADNAYFGDSKRDADNGGQPATGGYSESAGGYGGYSGYTGPEPDAVPGEFAPDF